MPRPAESAAKAGGRPLDRDPDGIHMSMSAILFIRHVRSSVATHRSAARGGERFLVCGAALPRTLARALARMATVLALFAVLGANAHQASAAAQKQEAPSDSVAAGKTVQAEAAAPIRLFGTVEYRTPIKNLPKWARVKDSEVKRPSFGDKGLDTKSAKLRERWAKVKSTLVEAPLKEQVQRVNNFFNQWPYKSDIELWGVEDYWATPREFVERSGDCEDYAIAKYYALRDLGVPASKMRVVAIFDSIRGIGHAVLVVFMDNDAYILDNLTNLLLSHAKLKNYSPKYSVNEEFMWRHAKPKHVPAKK